MDKALEIVLGLVIIGSALAFGGVEPLAYSLAELALFVAVFLLLVKQTRQGRIRLPVPVWPLLFVLLVVLQLVPLPPQIMNHLSPMRVISLDIPGLTGTQPWTSVSIYRYATVAALFKFLAYLSAFVLAAHCFDSGKRKSILVPGLIVLGCFEAAYGIIQYLTGWQKIFTYTKRFDLEEATGTYINRNHFAGLLELILPFVLAAAFFSFQVWSEKRHARGDRHASGPQSSAGFRVAFYLFLAMILLVALVFSRSRMGILAGVFAAVFVAILAQVRVRRKLWALGVFSLLICAVGYGIWIGLDPVLARFERIGDPAYLRLEGRLFFWKDGLELIRDYPLTGTGFGTFSTEFRRYQTVFLERFVDHAHNDYLEIAAETGFLGAALLFLPIVYLLFRMVISFLDDPRRYRRAVTLGCIGSTLGILLHSFTDFNLQIPANALLFAAILGIGYKAVVVERTSELASPSIPPGPHRES